MPRPGESSLFRPDIEGLRAVAVLAVVLFHTGVPGVGGGFVGVDVFFVISGFLITGLLWRQVQSSGTVRLAAFYGARARRLLPAAGLVLLVTAGASAVLLPPLRARLVLGDAVASALYVGNYRFALQGTDYLAADAAPSPVQHYWSLGVEEQFYLVWPALVIGTAWLLQRRRRARWRHPDHRSPARIGEAVPSVGPFLVVLALVAVSSFTLAAAWTTTLTPWAFFSLPSRAWQLAAGGLVALSVPAWRQLAWRTAAVSGWVGLLLVVVAAVRLGETTPYPGTAALLPTLGAVLVVGAGCAHADRGVGWTLSLQPVRALGRLSYSWYLWHWPVLLLAPELLGHPLTLPERLASAALSAALALVTLHLVENPARFAVALRGSPARSLALGAVVTSVGLATALMLLVVVPGPLGRGPVAAAPVITTESPPPAPAAATGVRGAAATGTSSAEPRDAVVQQLTRQVEAAVAASASTGAVPANLSPPLADAPDDKPDVFVNGCVRSWLYAHQPECASGVTTSATRVVLLGDSHAAMWTPALQSVAGQRQWRLETMSKVLCPVLDLPIESPYLKRHYTECDQWRAEVLARVEAERPALVVLDMSRRYTPDYGFDVYGPAWLDSLGRTVTRLRTAGAAVLVLGPVPDPGATVPTCLSAHLDDISACSPARSEAVNAAGIAAEAAATTRAGGGYGDLTSLFCTSDRCPAVVGNQLVFRDDNHITVEYARTLAPVLAALADRARSAP